MNDRFDQLTKNVARSVTRRQALKRFGLGLAAMAMAGFALQSRATNRCIGAGQSCSNFGSASHSCNQCCGGTATCTADKEGRVHCVCD